MYIYIHIYIYIYISLLRCKHALVPLKRALFDSQVSRNQNDETRRQNSLRHLSKVHLPIALT